MLCCDCRSCWPTAAGDLTGNFRIEFHARLLWLFAAAADDDDDDDDDDASPNTSTAIPYIKEREFTNARIQFMN